MRKMLVGIAMVISIVAAGIHLTPQADELDIDISVTETEENSVEADSRMVSADDETVAEITDEENLSGEEVEIDGGTTRTGHADEDLLGNVAVRDLDMSDPEATEEIADMDDPEEEPEEIVPDEPDNVVDTEEDDYYDVPQEYVYDDRPFDASYITGEGVDRIRKVIIAYAQSLGGTFMSPYYKGGQAVSIQCCAYVNQVWKHVFGKDIYDTGVMTTTSHEGETIYSFLERTGARAGDILYVRYWKVKKNDWSSHFMILLDYDETGVYVTDGYETDDGKFLVWRIDKKAVYSKSNFFKTTGSDKSRPGSKHWTGKVGSFFKLYRMRQEEWCTVANSTYNEYATDPMVRSVFLRPNLMDGTYMINAIIYSSNGLDRVQFPVWTVADGQDDLMPYFETDKAASGVITDLGDDMYDVTYVVSIADHNFECGNYMGEIYMYDNEGVLITSRLDAVNMDGSAGSVCVEHIPWVLE